MSDTTAARPDTATACAAPGNKNSPACELLSNYITGRALLQEFILYFCKSKFNPELHLTLIQKEVINIKEYEKRIDGRFLDQDDDLKQVLKYISNSKLILATIPSF